MGKNMYTAVREVEQKRTRCEGVGGCQDEKDRWREKEGGKSAIKLFSFCLFPLCLLCMHCMQGHNHIRRKQLLLLLLMPLICSLSNTLFGAHKQTKQNKTNKSILISV